MCELRGTLEGLIIGLESFLQFKFGRVINQRGLFSECYGMACQWLN